MPIKSLLRPAVRALSTVCYRLQYVRIPTGQRIPVLCYHRFLPDFSEPGSLIFSVTPDQFEQQLQMLETQGYTSLSLAEYVAIARGERTAPPRSVLLTVDDGYYDVLPVALPIAERYGMVLNLFILSAETQSDNNTPYLMVPETPAIAASIDAYPELWRTLNWEELRHLRDRGVGIGLHGHTHERLSEHDIVSLRTQLSTGIDVFQREMGTRPLVFAIPYGNPKAYNRAILALLKELQFQLIFSTNTGRSRLPFRQLPLRRFVVAQDDDLDLLKMKLAGAYDWLGWLKQTAGWIAPGRYPQINDRPRGFSAARIR